LLRNAVATASGVPPNGPASPTPWPAAISGAR
jgi:hypothetical protein